MYLSHERILRAIATSDSKTAVSASNELLDFLESFTKKTVELRAVY